MSSKEKGSRREREYRDRLLGANCLVVKAGGSLGAFDLVGIDPPDGKHLHLVQCKSNAWAGPGERAEMVRLVRAMPRVLLPVAEIARCDDHRGWQILRLDEGGWRRLLATGELGEEVFEA
jgi:hypothetical protein